MVAACSSDVKDLDDMREELADRFGKLPRPVDVLLQVAELKIDASLWFVKSLQVEDDYLFMSYSNRARIEHLAKLHDRRLRIVDSQKAYWVTQPKKGAKVNWIEEARQAFRCT